MYTFLKIANIPKSLQFSPNELSALLVNALYLN